MYSKVFPEAKEPYRFESFKHQKAITHNHWRAKENLSWGWLQWKKFTEKLVNLLKLNLEINRFHFNIEKVILSCNPRTQSVFV